MIVLLGATYHLSFTALVYPPMRLSAFPSAVTLCTALAFVWGSFLLVPTASAQYYINQNELAEVLTSCQPGLQEKPEMTYEYFELYNSQNNSVLAKNTFYHIIGDGDGRLGKMRSKVVGLLNRQLMDFVKVGDVLVVPSYFDDDFCLYAPFPRFYAGGQEFDKLFIIDKSVQAFAAYEYGRLVRWGIVNTGAAGSRTPNGRFNFNWKTEYRVSSLSPPGEEWEMYWVFNFHLARGIHIHQYAMPTGGPTSKGCVRMVEEDAKFIYNWATPWQTASGSSGFGSQGSRLVRPGTTVLIIGEDPPSQPQPFIDNGSFPTLRKVLLPAHPYDVPPGTDQQRRFDRMRGMP